MKRTPLKRGKPPKRKGKSRFPKRRNDAFRKWVRETEACALDYFLECDHLPRQCAHVKSRGAGGDDVGNCVAMCPRHHRKQHRIGIKSFERQYGVDLKFLAAVLGERWKQEQGAA